MTATLDPDLLKEISQNLVFKPFVEKDDPAEGLRRFKIAVSLKYKCDI